MDKKGLTGKVRPFVFMATLLWGADQVITRIEKRTDMYISTLRGVIKAMGGDLETVARFPDGNVRINQFEELDDAVRI